MFFSSQVREIDPYAGSSPALGGHHHHSRGSTASEALDETVNPFLKGSTSKRGSSGDQDGRQSADSMGSELEEEARISLAVLLSSDDRMEFTLSPGTMETILTLLEVHMCVIK